MKNRMLLDGDIDIRKGIYSFAFFLYLAMHSTMSWELGEISHVNFFIIHRLALMYMTNV